MPGLDAGVAVRCTLLRGSCLDSGILVYSQHVPDQSCSVLHLHLPRSHTLMFRQTRVLKRCLQDCRLALTLSQISDLASERRKGDNTLASVKANTNTNRKSQESSNSIR